MGADFRESTSRIWHGVDDSTGSAGASRRHSHACPGTWASVRNSVLIGVLGTASDAAAPYSNTARRVAGRVHRRTEVVGGLVGARDRVGGGPVDRVASCIIDGEPTNVGRGGGVILQILVDSS